jgi:hypothetical protein
LKTLPNAESRAKVIIGIATTLIAACLLKIVLTVDLSRNSTEAAYFAKGTVGALGVMFCLLLFSRFGRVLRKIVGAYSLLLASLHFLAFFFGVFAVLVESMPLIGIFGGREPAAFAAGFAANAYIAWAYCFSSTVRAYERKPNQ